MKTARVIFHDCFIKAQEHEGKVLLATGELVLEDQVEWLPPVVPGTTYAIGLNYADHAKELSFKAPKEPLVFLKGQTAFAGIAHIVSARAM